MRILLTAVLLYTALNSFAQTVITGQIKNATPGATITVNVPFSNWLYNDNNTSAVINKSGLFIAKIPVKQPQFVVFTFNGTRFKIYAEPTKDIRLAFDAKDMEHTIVFSDGLANENNLCVKTGTSFFSLYPKLYKDSASSPVDIYTKMKQAQASSWQVLNAANNLSSNFRQMIANEIAYYPAVRLFELSFADEAWSVHPSKPPQYALTEWKRAITMAYDDNPLSNNSAVNSYNYLTAINNLPFFTQHKFDTKEDMIPVIEKIMAMPFTDALTVIRSKGKSYFDFKALTFYLHDTALQKALACFIDRQIHEGELGSIDEAYNCFKDSFPNSVYAAYVTGCMTKYLAAKAGTGDDYTFITDTTITLKQAFAPLKGRVVYIDLWGTWCPACRDEMKYTHAVKEKYANKPVAFMYLAVEHTSNPEKNWRETVKFFNLPGVHVLANKKMQQYIKQLYKNNLVFPSYILIDKNGNIVQTNAARPSEPATLYSQIDALL